MGYMRHHAIVVTSFDRKKLEQAFQRAQAIGDMITTDIAESATNGYRTFCVVPDGSKAGWPESEHGDSCRDEFKRWLRAQAFEDGSSVLAWIEVMYGDDNHEVAIVDDGDAKRRVGSGLP